MLIDLWGIFSVPFSNPGIGYGLRNGVQPAHRAVQEKSAIYRRSESVYTVQDSQAKVRCQHCRSMPR